MYRVDDTIKGAGRGLAALRHKHCTARLPHAAFSSLGAVRELRMSEVVHPSATRFKNTTRSCRAAGRHGRAALDWAHCLLATKQQLGAAGLRMAVADQCVRPCE